METIAWIPLLPCIPGAAELPEAVADRDPGRAHEEGGSSSDAGRLRPVPVVDGASRRAGRPVFRGCRWRSIALLAVAAAVVWGLVWRSERLRLASQRRSGERIAIRPIDPADSSGSVVP